MIRSILISFVFSTILFAEFESDLQLKLILAEPGDTIHLESGMFCILGTLSMEGKNNEHRMKIAIDGTAASGKGTLSENLSKELKLPRLDTGLLLYIMDTNL